MPEKVKEQKETVKKPVAKKAPDFGIDIEKMYEAGLHFGHKTSRINPKMKPYIFGVRNTVHIIDLDKTVEKLKEALNYIYTLVSEEKTILFVGTKIQTKEDLEKLAKECNVPYVSERWIGGTFTNL